METFRLRFSVVAQWLAIALVGLVLVACPPGGEGEGEGETETIMLRGGVALEMVWIPAGSFAMGRNPGEPGSGTAEDPQHPVTLTSGFWMGKYELTKAQWEAVMRSEPWWGNANVLDDPDSPAVYMSWENAQEFITALNNQTGLTFRLPTEAEWEYACRAGTTTRFYWGDDPGYTVGDDYAWWQYNALDVSEEYAHMVGQKEPNAWGLFDMSGNALEWCDDWFGSYPSAGAIDPVGPLTGTHRVMRGGCVNSQGGACRSANRAQALPASSANYSFGFRLAR
jgi:formylglycine-generating enzyme required for sulfatase activity